VFTVLPDLFFLMDSDGLIVDYRCNDDNELYVKPAKFLGQKMEKVLPENVADIFAKAMEKAKQTREFSTFEYQLTVHNKLKYFEARISYLPQSKHVIAIIRDIDERKNTEIALQNSEHVYKQMFQENRAIKLIIDPNDGHIIEANNAAIDFYGYGQNLLSMRISDIRESNENEVHNQMQMAQSKKKTIFRFKHKLANGEIKDVDVYSGPISVGSKTLLYSIIQDVSDRSKVESSLLAKEKQLQDLFDNTTSVAYIKDLSGKYIATNKQYEKLLGVEKLALIGKTDYDLFPSSIADQFVKADQEALTKDEPIEREETAIFNNKERYYISVKFPLKNANNEIYAVCGISTDITDRKKAEQQILHQAHYDALTELPNRFLSLDRLSHMLIEAKRNGEMVAVLFLDLDNFKKINDSLGHELGDKLLIEAAKRLKTIIRGKDTVGRLGGDEFIILLRQLTDSSYAQPVVEHLVRAFRVPFFIEGRELTLTLSVGIALYPENGLTESELLRNADSAMYHAKSLGRNTFSYFTQEMNQKLKRQIAIEQQIAGALERGEFTVHYQPQIDIATKQIIGAEALIRWFNPTLKNVSPVEFIPIAEQTGLIVALGKFVLKEALNVIGLWQREKGTNLRMAVNLSPRQFRDTELVPFVKQTLLETGIKADKLELEITEGVLLSGHSYVASALNELAEIGVLLSMDDFGTGYSSLSYLRQYPFKVLKIDRCFVDGLTNSIADKELVKASIALAHSLDLKVVAEGVETQEQLAILNALNCDFGQGFFMAKPMPADALLHFKLSCFN
jgi:diguanylate cyclase (GGDEF)-like protein/PAS domain S-box-containing protein